MHDRRTGITQRLDFDAHDNPAGDHLFIDYAFSGNARVLAMSTASALTDDDANGRFDLYLRDLGTVSLAARFEAMALALQDVSAPGALQTALSSARRAIEGDEGKAACRAMTHFERGVQARWNRDIPSPQAAALFTAAAAIARQLGCLDRTPSFRWSRWTIPVSPSSDVRFCGHLDSCHAFMGDVDGDGELDVIVDSPTTIRVLVGDGTGSFRTRVDTGISGVVMAAADLNGDSRTDLVVSDGEEFGVRLLTSERAGTVMFSEAQITLDAPPRSAAVADLTGDGHVDVVMGHEWLPRVTVLSSLGQGRFGTPQSIDTGDAPLRVALADVTDDGYVDLVYQHFVSDDEGRTLRLSMAHGTGAGLPQALERLTMVQGLDPQSDDILWDFRLANVEGDTAPELIAWEAGRIEVYRFTTEGLVLLSTLIGRPVWTLDVADLDGDQRPDLILVDSPASFSIVHGNGDGTFGMDERVTKRAMGGHVSVADMNRDGRIDVVADGFEGETFGVTVLLNRPAVFIETPNDPTSVSIGTAVPIAWVHSRPAGTAFRIDVSRDAGKTWTTIAARIIPRGTSGLYAWTVTGPATTHGRFRVTSLDAESGSDANNSSVVIGAPWMKLQQPRAGDKWGIGADRRVTWSHNLGVGERAHVDLSRDDGHTWTRLASDVRLTGTRSSQFPTIATGPETMTARVRVSWARDPSLNVVSGAFRIAPPFIQIVDPAAGARVPRCSYVPIAWRHNLGTLEHVKVEASDDAGATWRAIATSFRNNGAGRSSTIMWWVWGPEVDTGMVRVSWKRDDSVSATVGNLVTQSMPTLRLASRTKNSGPAAPRSCRCDRSGEERPGYSVTRAATE